MNLNQLWLSLALGASAAALPTPTSKEPPQLYDVQCFIPSTYLDLPIEARGVYMPRVVGERLLEIHGPDTGAFVIYSIPEGSQCVIAPAQKQQGDSTPNDR